MTNKNILTVVKYLCFFKILVLNNLRGYNKKKTIFVFFLIFHYNPVNCLRKAKTKNNFNKTEKRKRRKKKRQIYTSTSNTTNKESRYLFDLYLWKRFLICGSDF